MEVGPPVAFDFGGVLALCRDLWSLAEDLESYALGRDGALKTALQDWRGPEAIRMVTDVWPAEARNLSNGLSQLRNGAVAWANSWAEAQRMYNNRQYALAVEAEQDSRSTGESIVDSLLGQDDSGQQAPSPADSAPPQPPAFQPGTGFVSYLQVSHSDWSVSYHTSDSPGVTAGAGGASW